MYRPLDAGALDKRVLIQSCTQTDDAAGGGGLTETWATVAAVRASIDSGSGREFVAAQQLFPELSHVVKMRYRPGVTAKHRLLYGSRALSIHAVIDVDERHEQLVCYCSEVAA